MSSSSLGEQETIKKIDAMAHLSDQPKCELYILQDWTEAANYNSRA
ncbi:MAG: hypothetical protein ACJ71R_02850 [Nitrososphaeraceae archaeon]